MRKLILIALMGLSVTACSKGGIYGRKGPDEFQASRLPPLVVPPDFALAPPAAGSPQAQAADSSTQALEAMFGGAAPRSDAERAALSRAGANRSVAGIRSNAGDPATDVVDKGIVTRDIIAAPEGDGAEARASVPQ
jgi:Protein of unknown function (DUF3035)